MREVLTIVVASIVGVIMGYLGSTGSVLLWGWPMFALSTACAFLIQWAVFIPSYAAQTEHFYDLTGALTYMSLVVFGLYFGPATWVHYLMGGMVMMWALRLGSFLFGRVQRAGGDSRFENKKNWAWFLMAWTLQGLWVVLTSAPVLVVLSSPVQVGFHPLIVVGALLWCVGMSVEITADRQKTKFRAEPSNKGTYIRSGLWGIVRHPNYSGEILLWSGLAVMAIPQLQGAQYAALVSPVFVFMLLRYISGVPLLTESAEKKWGHLPEFREYMDKTPTFIPSWRSFTEDR